MWPFSLTRICWLLASVTVAAWSSSALAKDVFRYPEGRHGKGELRYIEKVPVLIVRGSPAEMGEQIGTLAMKPAARVMKLLDGYANRQIPANVRPIADLAVHGMYEKFPKKYRDELEAVARVGGVDVRSLMMANTIIDLQEMIGCASLIVRKDRSATKGALFGHNTDLPYLEGLWQFSLLIIWHPDDGHAFALPTLPGFMMLAGGLNDKGLAWGTQSIVGAPRDGTPKFDPAGLASAVAARRLMEECDDIPQARVWLEKNRLARCVSVAVCDPKQHAVLEITTRRVLSRDGNEGTCCATNHFRCAELAANTDCDRYSILIRSRDLAPLGVKDIATFLKMANQGKLTFQTMVFEPEALRIHLGMAATPATDSPRTTINLAEFFKAKTITPSK